MLDVEGILADAEYGAHGDLRHAEAPRHLDGPDHRSKSLIEPRLLRGESSGEEARSIEAVPLIRCASSAAPGGLPAGIAGWERPLGGSGPGCESTPLPEPAPSPRRGGAPSTAKAARPAMLGRARRRKTLRRLRIATGIPVNHPRPEL